MINKLNDQQYEKFKELFPRANAAIEELSEMGSAARNSIYLGTNDFAQTFDDLNVMNPSLQDVVSRATCLMILHKDEIEVCTGIGGAIGIIVDPDKMNEIKDPKRAEDKDIYVAAWILLGRNNHLRLYGFIPVNNVVPDNFMQYALDEENSKYANTPGFREAMENFDGAYLIGENQLDLNNVQHYILHDDVSDQQAADMFYGLYRAFKTTKNHIAAFAVICFDPNDEEGSKTKTILVVNGSADVNIIAKDMKYIAEHCRDGFVDNSKDLGFECESKYAQLIPLAPVD